MKTKLRNTKIKWRLIILVTLCWFVPVVVCSVFVSIIVSARLEKQATETVTNSLSDVVSLIEADFEDIRKESRNASYFGVVLSEYNKYLLDDNAENLYSSMNTYLAQQYRYNKLLKSTTLIFTDYPDKMYFVYDSASSYEDVLEFKQNCKQDAMNISSRLDTKMYLYTHDGELYLLRNMVSASYKPYALVIMQLNCDEILKSLSNVWGYKGVSVYLDSECIFGKEISDRDEFSSDYNEAVCENILGKHYAHISKRTDGRIITYIVELDESIILSEQRTGRYILIIFILSMIPLGVIVLRFFDRMITKPVNELVKAAGEIGNENYGYRIESEGYSKEFSYLNESFNEMGGKLKQQFEQIYLEELAVRDANIKALQSQINPHFINNTLEIINWEARLNGVYKVSGMIEALSTMLNATLNRKKMQTIPLSEELEYVDAYLYIISERMGKRLTIEKNIDERLLKEPVPRLIAQPIVENAVEHGVTTYGNGTISIDVYADGEFMFLRVRNTGGFSKEDREKVERLLSGNYDEDKEHSVSIGISNVNKRLKLMYGDACGLTISGDEENTVSLLKFKREGVDIDA